MTGGRSDSHDPRLTVRPVGLDVLSRAARHGGGRPSLPDGDVNRLAINVLHQHGGWMRPQRQGDPSARARTAASAATRRRVTTKILDRPGRLSYRRRGRATLESRRRKPQDRQMLALIVLLAVVLGVLGIVFWNVTRTKTNVAPALGTNNPYPDGVGVLGAGEDAPAFLPTPIVSEAEEFRRDAHLHLAKQNSRARSEAARSWMEEPGAMEAAGLVDAPELPSRVPATEATDDGGARSRGSQKS